jgi:hypothetical protein
MKQSPQWIYERVYCQRGDIENRINELHELEIDRTSCTSFWANQFRVLLTAAAYVLDAGVALAGCRYRLRPRPSWHAARTTAEARRSGVAFSTTSRRPSARFLPVSTRLPSCGSGSRRCNRLNPFSQFTNSTEIQSGNGHGTPVSPSCKLDIQISELCDGVAYHKRDET